MIPAQQDPAAPYVLPDVGPQGILPRGQPNAPVSGQLMFPT